MCNDDCFHSFFLRSGLKSMDMRVLLQAFTCAGVESMCMDLAMGEPGSLYR